jgi:membrane-associated phospholipid phosphatase
MTSFPSTHYTMMTSYYIGYSKGIGIGIGIGIGVYLPIMLQRYRNYPTGDLK